MEHEPLRAPKRLSKEDHKDLSESDPSTKWILVGLAALMLLGIAYSHFFMKDPADSGQSLSELVAGGNNREQGGPQRPGDEGALEKIESLPTESYAGAVTHASDSDACSSLRTARDRVRDSMRKPHSSWEASEYRKDLESIRSRGTQLGCWSGGPQ